MASVMVSQVGDALDFGERIDAHAHLDRAERSVGRRWHRAQHVAPGRQQHGSRPQLAEAAVHLGVDGVLEFMLRCELHGHAAMNVGKCWRDRQRRRRRRSCATSSTSAAVVNAH